MSNLNLSTSSVENNYSSSEDVTTKSNCSSFIGKIPSNFYIPRTYSLENNAWYFQDVPIIRQVTDDSPNRQCNCIIL